MEFIDVSSTTSHREPPEPEDLLEECWFFGNLFVDSKSKMSNSSADLGPSSNCNTQGEMSVTRSEGSQTKGDDFDLRKLARAPSLPSYMEPKVDMFDQGKDGSRGSNSRPQNNLTREQSLPACFGRQEEDEDEDEESEFMLGRLIRQASVKSSHVLPPRHDSKSLSKNSPRKTTDEVESNNTGIRGRYVSDGTKIRRSRSDIPRKELRSFKTLASVEEECRDETKEKMTNKYSPRILNWGDNEKRSSQDMKSEIKFWARAVASNVASPSPLIVNRN
ncbi:hypothetical protein DCAR_0519570 [Daucus carota subsp. sativus]|uniref:Uncharacterized protein n=1 Tax=Daucus carota subsp. sativus TaxID=79200 RepID=A0A164Y270_DAUCS|nr:PREDICTED: uncharacterized protein LOC108223829 [Daucus carota subsp. sativus]WOH00212.1 hypothetical protein DCAR_0519570 [Daucus carota subsp. sativus]